MGDIIIGLVIGSVVGFVIGTSLVSWMWFNDRKEVEVYVGGLEKDLNAYKNTYIIIKHQVEDAMMEFGTFDGGLNWYCVTVDSVGGVTVHHQVDSTIEPGLIRELCDAIAIVVNGDITTGEAEEVSIHEDVAV